MHHNFLFDLDQTLLDFHASERKALGIVLIAKGLSYSEEVYEHFKVYNKSLWLEFEKGTISRTELFTMRFNEVIRKCGGDPADFDALEINSEFINTMAKNGVLMEGSLDFVKRIKSDIPDSRIYIASNGFTLNAIGRIKSTGLIDYLDGIFVSEDIGVSKPASEFFDKCLEKIGEPKETCIMIGDSLTSDMLGAKNASITSVWFMPEGDIKSRMKEYDIDYAASSFDDIYEILKKWSEVER